MNLDRLPDLTLARDVSAAGWLTEELWDWGRERARVGSFAPACFSAHLRILHPAGPAEQTRWEALAAPRGVTVGPSTGFAEASGIEPGDYETMDGFVPEDGSLPSAQLDALRVILGRFTEAPDRCWFAYWDGWGIWGGNVTFDVRLGASRETVAELAREAERRAEPRRAYLRAIPRVRLPNREYFLFSGALAAPLESLYLDGRSPSLWWPDDRAWCVATEIDGYDTYLACGEAAAGKILGSSELEALRVTPEDASAPW